MPLLIIFLSRGPNITSIIVEVSQHRVSMIKDQVKRISKYAKYATDLVKMNLYGTHSTWELTFAMLGIWNNKVGGRND